MTDKFVSKKCFTEDTINGIVNNLMNNIKDTEKKLAIMIKDLEKIPIESKIEHMMQRDADNLRKNLMSMRRAVRELEGP